LLLRLEEMVMAGSGYSPRWRRWLQRNLPWLFVECLGRNLHWRWDASCHCMSGCNGMHSMPLAESVRLRRQKFARPR